MLEDTRARFGVRTYDVVPNARAGADEDVVWDIRREICPPAASLLPPRLPRPLRQYQDTRGTQGGQQSNMVGLMDIPTSPSRL